jgi:formamidopyrimidine-DNA glycosylase
MPELPEVETVKRGIEKLVGRRLHHVLIRHFNLRYPIEPDLAHKLIGKQILGITRRAKYLILKLEQAYLIIHLGMSGKLTLVQADDEIKKHDHVDLVFDHAILRYNDPRRFGCMVYTESLHDHPLFKHLGPEPLDEQFNAEYLLAKLKARKSTIKQLIMDNHLVVGVGNIYACEALFLAHISPARIGLSITPQEATDLVAAIKQVLALAIKLGGSSLRDYKQADGKLGNFQTVHNVYGKAGKKCNQCDSIILETRLGQRNSFYCPQCQK